MATVKYERGTCGRDQNGSACFVSRVVEVKDIKGTVYRYWVVDSEDEKPGTGPMRLLELGAFVGPGPSAKKVKREPEFIRVMIPACEAIPVRRW